MLYMKKKKSRKNRVTGVSVRRNVQSLAKLLKLGESMAGFFNQLKEKFSLKRSLKSLQLAVQEKEGQVADLTSQVQQLDQVVLAKTNEERMAMRTEMYEERRVQEEQIEALKMTTQQEIEQARTALSIELNQLQMDQENKLRMILQKNGELEQELAEKQEQREKAEKELKRLVTQIKKGKVESLAIKNLIEFFPESVNYDRIGEKLKEFEAALNDEGILDTVVHLDLHYKTSRQLRSQMNANNKDIHKLITSYQSRYTTKANITIYDLMVIGLQAELQNILYTLTYTNLEDALKRSKALIHKYLQIASNGNASLINTITRFLMELEVLFEQAIRIEYSYYIQREKEKEEQRRIREQMKQELEEKRMLEEERKKIEKEEEKYLVEMNRNRDLLMSETNEEKIRELQERIALLESQYHELEEKKEEIIKRANGKAGHVYVISNLGSFGDGMFKIGMTRRLDPLERIDELGDASVPFKFDVHAMMFSNDAVALEQQIHQQLAASRVNKINMRKEFFYADVKSLEKLVQDIDSTTEFTMTMIAQEYRQSLSITDVPNEEAYLFDEEEAV